MIMNLIFVAYLIITASSHYNQKLKMLCTRIGHCYALTETVISVSFD